MSGSLLDTNIVIALFSRDTSVVRNIGEASEVFVPCIVIGELYYGAFRSARAAGNLARIEDFAAAKIVLPCDSQTCRLYGSIKSQLRAKGRPIPENDIWIAAIAQQHGLSIISRDEHFHAVDDLPVQAW